MIDLDLQGQIELQSQNLPHFELVHAITHHQLKLQFPNLEQKCILALFRSLPILDLIETDLQFNFFSPCSLHRIIMKFSGVITNDKSDVHARGQGQGSKVKVTEVNTQLNRFRTVTPVWIHIWWWNDAYSLMMLRRGALLFFKVIRQISRSHGSKNRRILPKLDVSGL